MTSRRPVPPKKAAACNSSSLGAKLERAATRSSGITSWIQNDAGDLVELTPMRNLGRRDGIDYLVDLIIRVDKVDADSIGRALREALDLADEVGDRLALAGHPPLT
jgi:hypothetical protein